MHQFFTAVAEGHLESVRSALLSDPSLANALSDGPIGPRTRTYSALEFAIVKRNLPVTRLLLDHGAALERPLKESTQYALHLAVAWWPGPINLELVELLISRGASTKDSLHAAIGTSGDTVPVIELLLKHGAHVTARNSQNRTPLLLALFFVHTRTNLPLIDLLIRHGSPLEAEPGSKDESTLSIAARTGDPAIVNLLIQSGANVNASHKWGTPLHRAARNGYDRAVSLLLENGANPRALDHNGQTPLALTAKYEEAFSIMERHLASK